MKTKIALSIALGVSVIWLIMAIQQPEREPETITVEVEKWRTEKIIQPVYKAYYPNDYREFESREAVSEWLAQHYIGKQDDWNCVDYAQAIQRQALEDGYLVSIELTDTNLDKVIDHAICSTWVGRECIFFEPQSTVAWVGAVKGGYGE